jgi:hypothetical protein
MAALSQEMTMTATIEVWCLGTIHTPATLHHLGRDWVVHKARHVYSETAGRVVSQLTIAPAKS